EELGQARDLLDGVLLAATEHGKVDAGILLGITRPAVHSVAPLLWGARGGFCSTRGTCVWRNAKGGALVKNRARSARTGFQLLSVASACRGSPRSGNMRSSRRRVSKSAVARSRSPAFTPSQLNCAGSGFLGSNRGF